MIQNQMKTVSILIIAVLLSIAISTPAIDEDTIIEQLVDTDFSDDSGIKLELDSKTIIYKALLASIRSVNTDNPRLGITFNHFVSHFPINLECT